MVHRKLFSWKNADASKFQISIDTSPSCVKEKTLTVPNAEIVCHEMQMIINLSTVCLILSLQTVYLIQNMCDIFVLPFSFPASFPLR
jgi:hypothetical protein